MLRIVTYNLRAGGAGKTHWSKVFDAFDPDLFLVQESYEPIEHLPPSIHGDRYRDACWTSVAGLKWGSAVYAKGQSARRLELPDFCGHVVGVEIEGGANSIFEERPLRIFSIHAPDRGGYQRAVNSILDMIMANRGDDELVIGGDFNLTVGSRLKIEELQTSKADLAILARLHDEFGLVSAWRAANANDPLPQTLRWAKNPAKPYHCDGIFIPERWTSRLRRCTVISGPEWNALSDHNPVMVEIL